MVKSKKIILLDIDDTIFNTAKFYATNFKEFEMYDEVHKTLDALSNVATLGIFSQGDIAFQKGKLIETKIAHLFKKEHTHIVEEKIHAVKQLLDTYKTNVQLYVVEDRLEILENIKRIDPNVFTIYMKRGRFADAPRVVVDYKADATVSDLSQILPLIENN